MRVVYMKARNTISELPASELFPKSTLLCDFCLWGLSGQDFHCSVRISHAVVFTVAPFRLALEDHIMQYTFTVHFNRNTCTQAHLCSQPIMWL